MISVIGITTGAEPVSIGLCCGHLMHELFYGSGWFISDCACFPAVGPGGRGLILWSRPLEMDLQMHCSSSEISFLISSGGNGRGRGRKRPELLGMQMIS